MKKRIFLLCCVVGVMMPTAVYGQGVPVTNAIVEQSNMYEGTVIQLQDLDTGRCYYLTQPAAVEDFLTEWKNAWLTGKSAELSHGYDRYRFYVLSDEQADNQDVQYVVYPNQNILSRITYTKDKISDQTVDIQSEYMEISSETMQSLVIKLETVEETYYPYDVMLYIQGIRVTSVDYADFNKLGMFLNGYLHVFQNAFIDANGTLQISLEDWNTIFATQYGEMKNLIYQNGAIKNNVLPTNIPCQNINGKVYIPLREAVNHFGHLTMEWDKQMRKAVVMKKAVFEKQQEYWSEVEKAAESLK